MNIGEIYKSNSGVEFEVIGFEYKDDKKHTKMYKMKSLETGYIGLFRSDCIKKGQMRDKLQVTVFGVGIIGYANASKKNRKYKVWYNMMSRCYNKNDKSYNYYGAKGTTVCDRWKRLDYFIEDIVNVEGYNERLFNEGKIFIDKDIKSTDGNKLYSLNTCIFVDNETNQKQKAKDHNLSEGNIKIAVFPDGHEEIIEVVKDFADKHNLQYQNINLCLNGTNKSHKGFKFYYKN